MIYYKINKKCEAESWHVWFAWKPVYVRQMPDGHYKKVWLQKVARKKIPFFAGPHPICCYETLYQELNPIGN